MPQSMMQGYGSTNQGNPLPPGSAKPSFQSARPIAKATASISTNTMIGAGLLVVGIILIVFAIMTW